MKMYNHPEYDAKASKLESSNSRALGTLNAVFSGLERIIGQTDDEFLPFKRIMRLPQEEMQYFEEKTIYQALTSPDVERRHLRVLKDYGHRIMDIGGLSKHLLGRDRDYGANLTRLGILIYLLAIAQAYIKFNVQISRQDSDDLRRDLNEIRKREYVVPSLRIILRGGLKKIPRSNFLRRFFFRQKRDKIRVYY